MLRRTLDLAYFRKQCLRVVWCLSVGQFVNHAGVRGDVCASAVTVCRGFQNILNLTANQQGNEES